MDEKQILSQGIFSVLASFCEVQADKTKDNNKEIHIKERSKKQ